MPAPRSEVKQRRNAMTLAVRLWCRGAGVNHDARYVMVPGRRSEVKQRRNAADLQGRNIIGIRHLKMASTAQNDGIFVGILQLPYSS
jgi:hypothetical protein